MTEAELRARMVAYGLGAVADAVLAKGAPAVGLRMQLADETTLPVGASKVGGHPDLPADLAWPAWWDQQVPMAFLGQFNLADLAVYDQTGLLPSRGLLAFFLPLLPNRSGALDGASSWWNSPGVPPKPDPPWRVLQLTGDPTTFQRRELPLNLPEEFHFSACRVRAHTAVTLPGLPSWEWASIVGEDVAYRRSWGWDIEANANLEHDIQPDIDPPHAPETGGWHLLGHPFRGTDSVLVRAHTTKLGSQAVDQDRFQRGRDWDAAEHDRAYYLTTRAEVELHWCLLLQATSLYINGMNWERGQLYFCIEREALARRAFDQTWLIFNPRP